MTYHASTRRRALEGGIALVLLGLAFWAGLQLERKTAPAQYLGFAADSNAPAPSLTVRDAAGSTVLLAGAGEPTVVMISSTSCGYCGRSLADIGNIANGDSLPRFRILTLEGIAGGQEMTRRAGLVGAWHAEPVGRSTAALISLNLPGTPVFMLLDSEGRVRRTMPGYPGREGLRAWVDVMRGISDSIVTPESGELRTNPLRSE